MGYSLGAEANRPTSKKEFEKLVEEAFKGKKTDSSSFPKLMLTGLIDGYEQNPNKIKGLKIQSRPKSEQQFVDLSYYSSQGNLQKVKEISSASNVNSAGFLGFPLHRACSSGHIDVVKHLVSIGAKTDQPNGYGYYPIHCAAKNGCLDTFKYLHSKGASIEQTSGEPYQDQIHIEVSRLSREKANDDFQPIHTAAEYNSYEICKYLLEQGVPHNVETNKGTTPLSYASGGSWKPERAKLIRLFDKDGAFEKAAKSAIGEIEGNLRTGGIYLATRGETTHCLRFSETRTVRFSIVEGQRSPKELSTHLLSEADTVYHGEFDLSGEEFNALQIRIKTSVEQLQSMQAWANGKTLEFYPFNPYAYPTEFGSYSGVFDFHAD